MPRTYFLRLTTAVMVIAVCWLGLNGPAGAAVSSRSEQSLAGTTKTDAETATSAPAVSPTPTAVSSATAAATGRASSGTSASGSSTCGDSDSQAAVKAGKMDAFSSSASTSSTSGRLVFAHYLPNFPVSIDNLPSNRDYYSRQYLNPDGEDGSHAAYGGLIRDRPLPRPVVKASNWKTLDVQREVREASGCGLNGFSVDILQTSGAQQWGQLLTMLQATQDVSKSFKIMLMPDMSVLPDDGPQQLADKLAGLAKYSSAFRLTDGRLVISPFMAEARSVTWWQQFMSAMAGHGVKVALVPVFVNVANWRAYAGISYGISDWGYRNPAANSMSLSASMAPRNLPKSAHALGKIWMQPVSVQDERPRVGLYQEPDNTDNLRSSWGVAIGAGADWVQLTTWNDYSEGTQFAPSLKHGWTFLQISQYYLKWWRTGKAPAVHGNQLFLTYRTQPYAAKPRFAEQTLMQWWGGGTKPRNTVEALTILARAATVKLSVGGHSYTCSAPAGVHTCTVSLSAGSVSATLSRGGTHLLSARSGPVVTNSPLVQDLQYVALTGQTP